MKILTIGFLLLIFGLSILVVINQKGRRIENSPTITINQPMLKIESPVFADGAKIPTKYTCDGQDANPPLTIIGVSAEAQSLVLIVDDPDAPGGTWTHWIVWNISPQTKRIEEGSLPPGAVEGINSFGKKGYGGPCPPSGTHRYFFKLLTLKQRVNLDSSAKVGDLEKAIQPLILDQTRTIGLYR